MADSEVYLPGPHCALLSCGSSESAAQPDWFDPGWWGDQATPVSEGGRGGAWFIHQHEGDWVLRHYRRGGLPAKVSQRSYLFVSERRCRSFAEFRLLRQLQALGLPVPEPVAAFYCKRAPWLYQAAILVRRIPGAEPLPASDRLREDGLWQQVGQMIRRFHDAGLDHVDLNVDNILVAGNRVYLIDFDRCRLHEPGTGNGWRERNLGRLKRSVEKRCQSLPEAQRERLWQCLRAAYAG
ncbi:3-deoxy-D-manno-octulosonic acid kinase [Marinobacter sp. SS21]|uniref:3-deoxy-D-manno-octulosonic acid kinase n=1 Tax=Marinobacter sp. SS21 TaxID=2979460 RepID=UPI00232BEB44|nr:3-deoxy-D-manno-octulosonic acid kinase [Marinobacter sp. SS21]MDC0663110.1 3-deoxy-D-manno-octulosonic acid kinase [Marinobacter sp. SS21]